MPRLAPKASVPTHGCPVVAVGSTSGGATTNPTEGRPSTKLELTAIVEKAAEDYIAFGEDSPGADTQGVTIEEARRNLEEAVQLVLEAKRALIEEEIAGKDMVREPLRASGA